MKCAANPNIDAFNADVLRNGGYLYSTNARLSSRMAHARLTEAVLALGDFQDQTVLDIGCGDGTYTFELYDRGRPVTIHALDLAELALAAARRRAGRRAITFAVGSAYRLPFAGDSFDWAILRAVLHHMDRPMDAVREALRVARQVIVVEPNGLNPVLKILEKCSSYHRAHDEKSFAPGTLRRWVRELGGEITRGRLVGLVPCFCPDWLARLAKAAEPIGERLPLVNALGCACYVFVARRRGTVLTQGRNA